MKVYVVTRDQYHEFSEVEAVFSTLKSAKAYLFDRLNGSRFKPNKDYTIWDGAITGYEIKEHEVQK